MDENVSVKTNDLNWYSDWRMAGMVLVVCSILALARDFCPVRVRGFDLDLENVRYEMNKIENN